MAPVVARMKVVGAVTARRAVARWAVRLFRREWRQQLLVLALLTLAVGATVFGASAAYNVAPSRDAEFGNATHRLELDAAGLEPAAVEDYLAAAEQHFGTIDVIGRGTVPVPGSVETVEVRSQDPNGAYGRPMLALRHGRYPSGAGEVALTDDVATLLGAGLGDTVALGDQQATVVGEVENPGALDDEFALVDPGSASPGQRVLVLVRGSEEEVRAFRPAGFDNISVAVRGQTEKATAAVTMLAVSTVALLLVSLVAAAGFTVVAQRRLRQLGMLAALGATPRHLRLVMLVNGAVVGLVAALAGTGIALVAWIGWATASPRLETAVGHRIDAFDVPWWLVATGVALAVATSTLAAWWPARAMARLSVTAALSARPPRPRSVHRSAVLAALLAVVGMVCLGIGNDVAKDTGNPPLFIGGCLAMVLAVLLVAAPALRGLALVGRRAPVAARLALRDLARYQARAGAALAAASLGLAIAVSVVVIAAAREDGPDQGNLSDRQLVVHIGDSAEEVGPAVAVTSPSEMAGYESTIDRIGRLLHDPTVVPLEVAVDPTATEHQGLRAMRPYAVLGVRVGPNTLRDVGTLFVASPDLLDHLGIDPGDIEPDTVVLTERTGDVYLVNIARGRGDRQPAPAQRIDGPDHTSAPRSLLPPAAAAAQGLTPAPYGWLVEADQPLTPAQVTAARELAADAGLSIEARRSQQGLATLRSVASGAGVLLGLGILALAIGLIRSESAGDLRTLTAAGATSRTRRTLSAVTAGALGLLAGVLGAGGAYLALVAGYWPQTEPLGNVPLAHLAVIVVGLPVAATAAGWLLAGREPPALARQPLD